MYNDAGVYSWFVCLSVLTIWIRKFAHNQTENNQTNIEQYYREDDEDDEKICRFIKINLLIIYFHSKNSKRIGIKREGWKREKLEILLTRKEQTNRQTDKHGIRTVRPLYPHPLWIIEGVGQFSTIGVEVTLQISIKIPKSYTHKISGYLSPFGSS